MKKTLLVLILSCFLASGYLVSKTGVLAGRYQNIAALSNSQSGQATTDALGFEGTQKNSLLSGTISWEKSAAKNNKPSYFGSNTERGMAVGKVNGKYKMYVVSRNGGNRIFVHDALSGDSLGTLINPKTTSGTFPINCAGVTQDGIIYVCNMVTDAQKSPFVVYRWASETDTGRTVLSYTATDAAWRIGDMFSVYGKGADVTIFAAVKDQPKVVKFTSSDSGKTFTSSVITLQGAKTSSSGNVSLAPDGSFYFKSYTTPIIHYTADGTVIDTIPASVVSSSITKINYFELDGRKFIAGYLPAAGQAGTAEKLQIFNVTTPKKTFKADESSSLGSVANTNGTGSVEFMTVSENGTDNYVFFLLGSNNGIGAFTLNPLYVPMPDGINWEKTAAKSTKPAYFGTDYERSMAYGRISGEDKIFVVSRTGGPKIVVHDAFTGDSLYTIAKPKTDVGYFPLNVVGVSEDGVIYAANMTLDASTTPFTVYKWSSLDTAKSVISYKASATGSRMGDAFNVYGKASDNSLTIFCGIKDKGQLVKFTTTDNGNTFTPTVITLEGSSFSSMPNIALLKDGSFYYKTYSRPLIHYSADGKMLDTVKAANSSATNIKYFEMNNRKYIAAYLPFAGQTGASENVNIIDVTDPAKSFLAAVTPSLGTVKNLNGAGSVQVLNYTKDSKEVVVFFVMGTNNGLAAFTYNDDMKLGVNDTIFYGNTKTLLANPYGAGFIAGANSYGDLGKYQRFDMFKDDEVNAVKFYFGYKKVTGTPDTLSLNIRTYANGKPGNILRSIKVTTDKIDTTGQGNVFFLDSTLVVPDSGKIFVGVEWTKTADDTVALFSDKNGEGNKKSRSWELYSDNSWGYFDQPGSMSWGLDADLWISVFYKKGPQITSGVENRKQGPTGYALDQNYPNPFNPATVIRFNLKTGAKVSLKVYNILGMEVANLVNGFMPAGQQFVNFNASKLASGIYIYNLKVEGMDGSKFNSVRKMMLLK
ncbi:MAG: T9SS type A sorting domain-containing protein [Acidobacteriota bacterium]